MGWVAKGGILLAATSALTVGAAAAATHVEETESQGPAPSAAEPAPPFSADPAQTEVEAAVVSVASSPAAEAEFQALTNQARAAAGAPALPRNAVLDEYARAHAATMMEAGQISHSNINSLLGPFSTVGENVGAGSGVGNIQAAFTQSPTHYANMVDPTFTSMGVGTVVDGAGTMWTVNEFGA